ncbi:MAG: hypothetical protein FJW39_13030 [Acidobacteria bacterium]|nr:hypothetical protein [Acidobacteriota bacterium]
MANAPALLPDSLGGRAFSFYPPIIGIEHNEWTFQEARWSEILVRNSKSAEEVWIPRNYLGEVSKVEEPVMIIGLKRELEYKGGTVWPHNRRVLQMPPPVTGARTESGSTGAPPPQPLSELRLGGTESRIGKLIGIALVAGILLTFLVVAFLRQKQTGGTIEYQGVLQAELGFTIETDFFAVVRKLGRPESDKWQSETGERQYRQLSYPKQDLFIILMGSERESVRYIGAKDGKGRIVHSVKLPGGRNTEPILRSLKPF